ncbi:DoxX family protein [candidate division GN15 bacterium]|uniref:DoxX family protein n=1 Tax=candidate division GN15 bacterium TaxID=2072418 RepID=A0A855XCN9_9BACT|nr:MAG: DoxX family protein [candidate division GN15 bacterium]
MRKLIDNDYLTLLSRLLVGGMFIYAAFYKIVDPAAFAKSIWFYHLVPGKFINLMALVLPWLEVTCGIAVIIGFWHRGAKLWANIMLIVFIAALGSTIVRGISIDCGCFRAAKSATHSAWNSLWFDVVALVFALQLLISRSTRWMLSAR